MAEIVITEFMDGASVEGLSKDYDTLYDPNLVERPADLIAAVAPASAMVVRDRTQVRGALLDAGRNLKVVGRLGAGLDNIDLEACRARGIEVCPATGANDRAVAEYVVAVVMMLVRGSYRSSEDVVSGAWPRRAMIGGEVAGRVLGLIGFGGIGRQVARRLSALGMRLVAHDPFVSPEDPAWGRTERMELADLLACSDAVSLHVPLTAGTRHLLDGRRIAAMRPGAFVVNTARGGVVDEAALAAALRDGHLGGAALDVFEEEPMSANAGARFAGLSNVILTPHIAGVTRESNVRVSEVTAENIRRVLRRRAATLSIE